MTLVFKKFEKKAKTVINHMMSLVVEQSAPVSSSLETVYYKEGHLNTYHTVEGDRHSGEFQQLSSGFELTKDEIGTVSFGEIIGRYRIAARDMAEQREKNMHELMESTVQRTGNIIDAKGEFDLDTMLQLYEKIEVSFEEGDRSKPHRPSLVMSEEAIKKMQEKAAKYTEQELRDYNTKLDKILDVKHKEYIESHDNIGIID